MQYGHFDNVDRLGIAAAYRKILIISCTVAADALISASFFVKKEV